MTGSEAGVNGVLRLRLDRDDAATRMVRRSADDAAVGIVILDATATPPDADAFLAAVADAPQPTIALLRGAPPDFAARLAAAADIAVASENQRFRGVETDRRFVAAIGARQARRFALGGEDFDAETARRIGLAQFDAMDAQLEATLDALLARLLARGAAAELRRAKAVLHA
ncbi:MAG: hypothetical protein K2Q06_05800 [Parvularculaceae bacterium]|nr:hypothetical protein [Parvularculaceae bacterium]